MNVVALPKQRMRVPEFLAWADKQPDGSYELVDGDVVAMAPANIRHAVVKHEATKALESAVSAAGVPCRVLPDGPGIVINDSNMRIPDAAVQCGVKQNFEALVLRAPVIVLEVVSPSSERDDLGDKLVDYFSVPSIRHYLVVLPKRRAVVHHMRNDQGGWSTYIGLDGDIIMEPPGIKVPVDGLLGPSSFDDEEEAGQ
jgi:Uma2 family endonuclease